MLEKIKKLIRLILGPVKSVDEYLKEVDNHDSNRVKSIRDKFTLVKGGKK